MADRYGIYNTMTKEFQFGISAHTKGAAERKLFLKIGHDSKKWRFEARKLPVVKAKKKEVEE